MNVKLVLAFVLPKASYLFVLLAFLQKFNVSENSLCMLFADDTRRQLHNIFLYNLVTIFKPHASYAMLSCSIL